MFTTNQFHIKSLAIRRKLDKPLIHAIRYRIPTFYLCTTPTFTSIVLKVNSNMSQESPLFVNSCVVKEDSEESENDIDILQVAINSPITKLQSPLRNKSPWYKYATVAVFYYAVAASFGALVTGCTLSFPSSAVLDLTDSELRKEYRFDERLSDIFGVSKALV